MRLAYICADPGVPVFGQKGCSIHVQEMLRAFQKQGIQIELFASRIGGNPPPDLAEIPVNQLPSLPKEDVSLREQMALAANNDLHMALEQSAPFDLIYERYSLWSYVAMEYADFQQIPGILEVNAPLIEEQATYRSLVHWKKAEQVAARVFNAASLLCAVSQEVADYLEPYLISQNSVYVVPNGVNPHRFPPTLTPSAPSKPNIFTVGFVGSLKPWHGLPILVEAFALLHQEIPDTRLLIVGDGTERLDLVANLSVQNLSEVSHLTGAVPPDEVPGLIASMDVAIAPYPLQSQFYFSPLKVYEYMAGNVPVVASEIGQLGELIEDGVNGILFPPGDALALAEKLKDLYWQPQLRNSLGQAGRSTVMQNHTWDNIVQRLLVQCRIERVVSDSPLLEVKI